MGLEGFCTRGNALQPDLKSEQHHNENSPKPSSSHSNSKGAVKPPTGLKSMSLTFPFAVTYTSIVSAAPQHDYHQSKNQRKWKAVQHASQEHCVITGSFCRFCRIRIPAMLMASLIRMPRGSSKLSGRSRSPGHIKADLVKDMPLALQAAVMMALPVLGSTQGAADALLATGAPRCVWTCMKFCTSRLCSCCSLACKDRNRC